MNNLSNITYPYLPEGKRILYAGENNAFMSAAMEFALENSLDKVMPNASLIIKNNKIINAAANGSDYHKKFECQRIKLKIPTGQGYELCEGCHYKNHSESKVIRKARLEGCDTKNADLYLWGHFWCCKPCWNEIITAKIKNVFLLEKSYVLFNKEHPENIVGKQFEVFKKLG